MKFVIIGSMRTGSTFLVHALDHRPDVRCHGEVFNRNSVFFQSPFRQGSEERTNLQRELRQLRASDPQAFVERIYGFDDGRPHVGFKMFMGHNDTVLDRLIADTGVGKIILRRFNVLAQYSSGLAAKATGAWGIRATKRSEKPLVKFDATTFIRRYERFARFYDKVATALLETGQRAHIMWTEELNDPPAFASLLDYIGAESADVKASEPRPHQSSSILTRFENSADVEQFLERNGLQHWATGVEPAARPRTLEDLKQMRVHFAG